MRLFHRCICRSRFRIEGIRERSPANLDSAFRIALQLEVWTKDVNRIRNEQPKQFQRKAREITRIDSLIKTNEELRKQVSELQDQLAKATLRLNAYVSVGRPAAEHHVAEGSRSSTKLGPKNLHHVAEESRSSTKLGPKNLHAGVVAVQITLFGCVRIKRQTKEE